MEHIKNFQEYDFNEGKTFKSTKKEYPKHDLDPDKKEQFRISIKNHIQSQSCKTKQIGDDFEIHLFGKHIGQVMFRTNYISVKKVGEKFNKQFKYVELGKIKSEITKIIKDSKDSKTNEASETFAERKASRAKEKAKGKIKCTECYGSGTVNTEEKSKNCKKCDGTGKIKKPD